MTPRDGRGSRSGPVRPRPAQFDPAQFDPAQSGPAQSGPGSRHAAPGEDDLQAGTAQPDRPVSPGPGRHSQPRHGQPAPDHAASVGSASVGSGSVGSASVGSASAPAVGSVSAAVPVVGSVSAAITPPGAKPVGSASVGSASVGAVTGSASVGAVTGSASVGTAPVRPAATGAGPAGAPRDGDDDSLRGTDAASLDRGNADGGPGEAGAAAAGVPLRGDAPVVGARAGVAKAADGPDEPAAGIHGELRRQMRSARRLRMYALFSLAAVVLVVLPVFFGVTSAVKDPVFGSLDALVVPSWATKQIKDESSGSRWCVLDCRFRERIAQSDKPFKETTQAYVAALTAAGWQPWKVAECPEQPVSPKEGTYSCWRRDEFTLDLWVRQPECAVDQVAAQDPDVVPSAAPVAPPGKCVGSTVSIKVQNAISDTRGQPEPAQSPGLVGETPDPVLSDDPLLKPTPKAS